MNLRDLILLFRTEVDDVAEPYLWSDEELGEYATDAQNEACRRARLLIDSSTTAVCQYNVLAGDPWITLDPRVIFVRRARVASRTPRLSRLSYRDLDAIPGWEAQTGTVQSFITDMETGKLRLYKYWPADDPLPVPPATATVMDTLNLTVVRLPLTDLTHLDDEVEIHARYARNLRHWMAHRAYLKRDEDTFDEKKAAQAESLFVREFGNHSSAVDEEWIERAQQIDDLDGTF